jgi:hypothetical protein
MTKKEIRDKFELKWIKAKAAFAKADAQLAKLNKRRNHLLDKEIIAKYEYAECLPLPKRQKILQS